MAVCRRGGAAELAEAGPGSVAGDELRREDVSEDVPRASAGTPVRLQDSVKLPLDLPDRDVGVRRAPRPDLDAQVVVEPAEA